MRRRYVNKNHAIISKMRASDTVYLTIQGQPDVYTVYRNTDGLWYLCHLNDKNSCYDYGCKTFGALKQLLMRDVDEGIISNVVLQRKQ